LGFSDFDPSLGIKRGSKRSLTAQKCSRQSRREHFYLSSILGGG